MLTQNHCDGRFRKSPYLHSESDSTGRTSQSPPEGIRIKRADAFSAPFHRELEQSLVVSRRDHLELDILADCLDLVCPSWSLEAATRSQVEIGENGAWLVRHLGGWLATHVVVRGDQRWTCESVRCFARQLLSLSVAARTSLSATQAGVFNAVHQGDCCRLVEPAVTLRLHTCRLRRRAPRRFRVTGDYSSGISAHAQLLCLFRPCGVTPWH